MTGKLEEPFETLLGDEIRQAGEVRSEAELQQILDEGAARDHTEHALGSGLVLAGAVTSGSDVAPPLVGGLKEKAMVEVTGLCSPFCLCSSGETKQGI